MSRSLARRSALPAFAAFAVVLPFGLSAANLTRLASSCSVNSPSTRSEAWMNP